VNMRNEKHNVAVQDAPRLAAGSFTGKIMKDVSSIKVSIVMPLYNKEFYVLRAVKSALEQTYSNFELIIIDDGSTDNGPDLVRKISDDRIVLISQLNKGVSAARNAGIKIAKAEWIAFLDADDEWLPIHLEECLHILDVNPGLIWCCAAFKRRPLHENKYRTVHYPLSIPNHIIEDFCTADGIYEFAWTSVMVIQREVIIDLGGFDETLRHGEDKFLWFKIGLHYPQIGYVNKIHATYWSTEGSLTNKFTKIIASEIVALIDKYEDYLDDQPMGIVERARSFVNSLRWRAAKESLKYDSRDSAINIYKKYGSNLSFMKRTTLIILMNLPQKFRLALHNIKSLFTPW
jgi:glycosyltransferase involved in cell wall biosynthesis